MNVLPAIKPQDNLSSPVMGFIQALQSTKFSGDVDVSYASRMAVATDNSIYQKLPQAVVFPKSIEDLSIVAKLSSNLAGVTFSARGGGTGTNGQSLTPGIVVDTSRYMKRILELNLDEKWVRVESGVVKDALNDFLAPHGYFFSPDLSTSNRATIGGMISTDASGQGSLVYGKTSDHLLGLTAVLVSGEVIKTKPISLDEAKEYAKTDTQIGKVYKQILESCIDKRKQVIEKFPRLNRFLTGYDLEHAYDDEKQTIDAGRLIAGAEGSLAFIGEAKLNITKIPQFTTLVNIKYNNFESALRHAPSMLKAQATSVETVDSKVLGLARSDIIWHSVSDLISEVPNQPMDGLNMVEYNTESQSEIDEKIEKLKSRLDDEIANNLNGVIGYQIISDISQIKKVRAMRKKSVGLLGNTKGSKKPLAFAEDTAVPPENLADFIMEFRALLDSHNLEYGMFGHVDAGVLHVRPALDLCDPEQEALVNKISDQVVALVTKYGGLMWGEHGKGYRSQYVPEFFGVELYTELRKLKSAFDPHNKMNPGKICIPLDSDDKLVQVSDVKRATYDRQIPLEYKQEFEPAMSCNGNGLCFNYDTTSPMCPSSKITQDRRHSPKGRATLIREWLFQLHKHGFSSDTIKPSSFKGNMLSKLSRLFNPKDDFNIEVFEAMNGCLACKSCSSQCPVGVDVPDFRAKFLAIYYTRYFRPLKDYFVAHVETLTPLMAKAPKFFNMLIQSAMSAWLLKKTIGYIDTPELSTPKLNKRIDEYCKVLNSASELEFLEKLADSERAEYVIIVQDPFTSFYDASVVEHIALFASKIGKKPVLLPFSPNGKPQHVKGFLKEFEKTARKTSQFLNKVGQLNIPMVGADASLVLCYRDEYVKALGVEAHNFNVYTVSEWLNDICDDLPRDVIKNDGNSYHLLAHCSEKTAIPDTENTWKRIYQRFGLELNPVSVGCCGMAGTYGHELEHFENSKGIYELSWSERVKKPNILVTGYSCRSQVKRFEKFRPKHPIEVLASLLD